ncbi:MAG: metallophosphoesterase family protein [Planctomycetaceae bacterium]|nr:metallophosphoesterase family protein [Planctomycetaceae bacterium]
MNRKRKMVKLLLCFLTVFCLTGTLYAQEKPVLKFSPAGTLRIVQIADPHYDPKRENKEATDRLNLLNQVFDTEKPDFAIYTGDVVNGDTLADWDAVIAPCIERKIPWALVFGNHDDEHGHTNEQILEYLQKKPYCLAERGPKDIGGVGNYVLEVRKDCESQIGFVLYCFDNAYKVPHKPLASSGPVGWFSAEQVQWYRTASRQYTEANGGKPLPALAFFHIPLDEYAQIPKYPHQTQMTGTMYEDPPGIFSGIMNSGLFQAMFECGDVQGTFCGHDHANDFIGLLHGIALAYGRSACQRYPIGVRVIEISSENPQTFKTWIRLMDGKKIDAVNVSRQNITAEE